MRRNLTQHGIGAFGNPMQRCKLSMLVFAVQPQRQYSKCDPVDGIVRVHGGGPSAVWTLDEHPDKRSTSKKCLVGQRVWSCRDGRLRPSKPSAPGPPSSPVLAWRGGELGSCLWPQQLGLAIARDRGTANRKRL